MARNISDFRSTPTGRARHSSCTHLERHCHREAFAAVALAGGYCEAGDRGRVKIVAGDVVLHGAFESHLDSVGTAGAEVLVLPWSGERAFPHVGRIDDPDLVARIAERDAWEAASYVAEQLRPVEAAHTDWPDLLARDLRNDPDLPIRIWADEAPLRRQSVSRGFKRVYGVAPAAFRARARTLKALALIDGGGALADIAAACGFADQAHMSRSVRRLTGHPPSQWRKHATACREDVAGGPVTLCLPEPGSAHVV